MPTTFDRLLLLGALVTMATCVPLHREVRQAMHAGFPAYEKHTLMYYSPGLEFKQYVLLRSKEAQFENPNNIDFVLDYDYDRIIFRHAEDKSTCYVLPMMNGVLSMEDLENGLQESVFKVPPSRLVAVKVSQTDVHIFLLPLSKMMCSGRQIMILTEIKGPTMQQEPYGYLYLLTQKFAIYF